MTAADPTNYTFVCSCVAQSSPEYLSLQLPLNHPLGLSLSTLSLVSLPVLHIRYLIIFLINNYFQDLIRRLSTHIFLKSALSTTIVRMVCATPFLIGLEHRLHDNAIMWYLMHFSRRRERFNWILRIIRIRSLLFVFLLDLDDLHPFIAWVIPSSHKTWTLSRLVTYIRFEHMVLVLYTDQRSLLNTSLVKEN